MKKKHRPAQPSEILAKKQVASKPSVPVQPGQMQIEWFQKKGPIFLGVCILIGGFLRIWNLDTISLWVDEFVHINTLLDHLNKGASLITSDNNGILYTLFALPFTKLGGVVPFWSRLPAVIFGVGTLFIAYQLTKRLYNSYVGWIVVVGLTISLYEIFWSRLCRNYSILGFFYLLTCYCFLRAFQPPKTDATNWMERWGIHWKWICWLAIAFFASLLSHQLTVFFVFGVMVYFIGIGVYEFFIHKHKLNWYTVIAIPCMLLTVLLFHPAMSSIFRKGLGMFVEARNLDWFMVNWDMVKSQWAEKPYQSWNTYLGVIKEDYRYTLIPGLAGLFLGFWINKRSAWFVFTQFVVILLLLSFIYRDPNLPRYFIYLYPIFWISLGACLYAIIDILQTRILRWNTHGIMYKFLLALPFLFICICWKGKAVKSLVMAEEKSGWIVSQNLTKWRFTNWNDASAYVKKNRKPGDIVMATIPNAVSYYLQDSNIIWWRQKYLDTKTRKYAFRDTLSGKDSTMSAQTLDNFIATINAHDRGWILADYYLYGPFTDPQAMIALFQSCHLVKDAVYDGSVLLFHWDKTIGKPNMQNFVASVGANKSQLGTPEFSLYAPESLLAGRENITFVIGVEGIEKEGQAYIILNNQSRIDLPANTKDGKELIKINCPASALVAGSNKFQFAMEEDAYEPGNPNTGYLVTYLSLE